MIKMNAAQLANVLQKVKADPVLQETLRVTKQDWAELNLTTQETLLESLQASMNIASAPEFSDGDLESMLGVTYGGVICTFTVVRYCSKNCNY
jgi:hypothetical protein